MAEPQQDVDTLKRRGRRRLVGAVALVLLAVIVLPMIFDPEPRGTPPVSVRIPGDNDKAFAPKPPAKAAAPAPKPAAPEEKKAEEKKAEAPKVQESRPAQKKAEAKSADAERARAEAALGEAGFVVQVGAFANPEPVIAKLAAAKMRYYTEKVATSKGDVTRVRAGPFATRGEAEKAIGTLKKLGLSPGGVSAKS